MLKNSIIVILVKWVDMLKACNVKVTIEWLFFNPFVLVRAGNEQSQVQTAQQNSVM